MLASGASLLVASSLAQGAADERELLASLAARCGDELRWARDWPEAAARGESERKPVLAVAWMYELFQIADGSRTGFAMDLDAIELVNERFVPLALTKQTEVPFAAQESYGISATGFGAGLLIVAPDGRVLADTPFLEPTAACDFLRAFLAAHPEFPGAPLPEGLAPEERAALHIARGELELASGCLTAPVTARTLLLQARLARLGHEHQAALPLLRAAREHQHGALASEIALEELRVLVHLGRASEARSACERLLGEEAQGEGARCAEYVLGLLDREAGEDRAAGERWRALVERHPESRWAALAAVLLRASPAELELGLRLEGPREDLLRSLQPSPWAPLPPVEHAGPPADAGGSAALREADDAAVRWLLASQRRDGSWPDGSEIEGNPGYFNAISAAIDALAARELLARADRPGCTEAAARAQRALLEARRSAARWPAPLPMDYAAWSLSAWLELLAAALEAGSGDPDELRGLGSELARELLELQRTNGGWSYFYSVSFEPDAAQLEQSISFVTAAVMLALMRAHETGIEVDAEALERGLDCLEAMRDEDGLFAYLLWPFQERAPKEALVAGAAGRSPACELALFRGERSDRERLRRALELFFRHGSGLAKERGKALMHCGPEGQGCHYVLFDYALAAQALAELPADERGPLRERMLALLQGTRRSDGSFLDAPVLGPTSGTALALSALRALEPGR